MAFDNPKIAQLEREVAHWKANHDEMVARNQLLRGRRDLPMERRAAYKEITERLDNQKRNIEKLLEFRAADAERIKLLRELLVECRERLDGALETPGPMEEEWSIEDRKLVARIDKVLEAQ